MDGGLTKISNASGTGARTWRAPCGSMVRIASRPAARMPRTWSIGVPYRLPCTSARSSRPPRVAQADEFLAVEEVVVHAVDLALAALAGCGGHDRHDLRVATRKLRHDRALADARRARDDHQHRVRECHALLGSVTASSASRTTSAPTPAGSRPAASRHAASEAAAGLPAARSTPCSRRPSIGRSSPSRDACRNWRPRPARPAPPP